MTEWFSCKSKKKKKIQKRKERERKLVLRPEQSVVSDRTGCSCSLGVFLRTNTNHIEPSLIMTGENEPLIFDHRRPILIQGFKLCSNRYILNFTFIFLPFFFIFQKYKKKIKARNCFIKFDMCFISNLKLLAVCDDAFTPTL